MIKIPEQKKEEVNKEPKKKSLKKMTYLGEMVSPEELSKRTGYSLKEIPEQVQKSGVFDIYYSGEAVIYERKR